MYYYYCYHFVIIFSIHNTSAVTITILVLLSIFHLLFSFDSIFWICVYFELQFLRLCITFFRKLQLSFDYICVTHVRMKRQLQLILQRKSKCPRPQQRSQYRNLRCCRGIVRRKLSGFLCFNVPLNHIIYTYTYILV